MVNDGDIEITSATVAERAASRGASLLPERNLRRWRGRNMGSRVISGIYGKNRNLLFFSLLLKICYFLP